MPPSTPTPPVGRPEALDDSAGAELRDARTPAVASVRLSVAEARPMPNVLEPELMQRQMAAFLPSLLGQRADQENLVAAFGAVGHQYNRLVELDQRLKGRDPEEKALLAYIRQGIPPAFLQSLGAHIGQLEAALWPSVRGIGQDRVLHVMDAEGHRDELFLEEVKGALERMVEGHALVSQQELSEALPEYRELDHTHYAELQQKIITLMAASGAGAMNLGEEKAKVVEALQAEDIEASWVELIMQVPQSPTFPTQASKLEGLAGHITELILAYQINRLVRNHATLDPASVSPAVIGEIRQKLFHFIKFSLINRRNTLSSQAVIILNPSSQGGDARWLDKVYPEKPLYPVTFLLDILHRSLLAAEAVIRQKHFLAL